EVIFPYRAAGRKDRSADLVGTISTSRPDAGLLDPGVHAEGRTGGERGDIQDLPSRGDLLAHDPQEAGAVERQGLNQAQSEDMGGVKSGRALFEYRMERVLRHRVEDWTRAAGTGTQN